MDSFTLHLLIHALFNCNESYVSLSSKGILEIIQLNQYLNIQNRWEKIPWELAHHME
jgi:hypothetical protein